MTEAMSIPKANVLGSLIVENQQTASDRDAAAVLDPDTFVTGAPFDALTRLRAGSPVHPVQLPGLPRAWLLTKHADVRLVSRDTDTFTSSQGNTLVEVEAGPNSALLPGIDPPRHVLYRKLINQGFTVRNVQRLEPQMRKVARDIVADITTKGEFDAVTDISAEISLQVIADVLGVPAEDRMDVFRWSNAIGSLGIEDPDYAPTPEALGQAAAEMFTYCGELVAHRRKYGLTDDILSALLAAEVDGEKLNRDQLNEFFLLLAIAGNETTRNTLSHGILALSEHPEQQALLSRDPETVKPAVEELLRWATPVMHFRRTVTSDVEIRGQHIPAGDWVLLHYLSANRDEEVFDRADEFDVTRPDAGHAAFGGGGVHFCLGAQLARLELRVMLEELYLNVPALTVTGPPDRLRSSFFHGIKRLPCSTG
ncbi:cytochrome P450 [Mycobacterium montefiorense]|uniref:Cytochrome P450 n=2 Tax=Mycobacterium montefiorense TaxID=154654 RepID=A0AA37PIE7_9MYCO|nr:cytochrome P450 [Mycobacterium montefiorense]GKU37927.1 cytochrome P450 [Mycobacterium montefiorense]GKU42122.1 cytochrome P450 [Mycobacterium montefiorense]GKU45952.1 cytochrome P450 [Mycobacterium montefiorense]GKU52857.1 cytochrome P450 [Mycobacterium montefiorense]